MPIHDRPPLPHADEPALGVPAPRAATDTATDPRLRAVLVVEGGSSAGRHYALPAGALEVRIGRGRDAEVRVRERSVSRSHALLRSRGDGALELRDLETRNGTFVNGAALHGSTSLEPGDRIRLGDLELRVAWMSDVEVARHEARAAETRRTDRDDHLPGFSALRGRLPERFAALQHGGEPFALAVLRMEPARGHPLDPARLEVATRALLRCISALRPEDLGVQGDEGEVWLLLPATDGFGASTVVERLRSEVEEATRALPRAQAEDSGGGAWIRAASVQAERGESPAALIARGREALALAEPQLRAELEAAAVPTTIDPGEVVTEFAPLMDGD